MMLAGSNDQQKGSPVIPPPAPKEESTIVKVGEASLWGLGAFFVGLPLLLWYLSNVQKEQEERRRVRRR